MYCTQSNTIYSHLIYLYIYICVHIYIYKNNTYTRYLLAIGCWISKKNIQRSLQHPSGVLVFVEESENVLHHLLLAGLAGLAGLAELAVLEKPDHGKHMIG